MSINLNKINLEKKGSSYKIDLQKNDLSTQEIIINLNWNKGTPQKKGFFASLFSKDEGIDLDLGCYYKLKDGTMMVIDGLQFSQSGGPKNQVTRQGCYTQSPWIWHSGDDRTGSQSSEGENILINPKGLSDIARITVYCFIYEGVINWNETDAIATIKVPNNPSIEVRMGEVGSSNTFCALADILIDKNSITVERLVSFHGGHADCDKAYNWGLKWQAGSK
jgi:tellurite resistance protein TerA